MDCLDIIKQTESILPNSFKFATIISNGNRIPLFEFLETKFIGFVKPGAKPQVLAQYINSELSELITLNDKRITTVENFIANNPTFKDVIQTGPDNFISAREYLRDYCIKNMTDTGEIEYVGRTITIEELYLKLLNKEYHAPTIEEKAELCLDMSRFIDNEVLSSTLDGMDITVRDYITKVIPTKMSTIDTVVIKGVPSPIDDFVKEIVDHQIEYLEKQKQEIAQAKEDEYNKTSDNPGLVSEIKVSEDLQVTAEIPVVTSSLLTDEEKNSLLTNYSSKESVTDEDYYRDILNKLKEAIDSTNNSHDLETKSNYFDSIVAEASESEVYPQIQALITSVKELIAERQRNIIKIGNNIEEYTDVLFSEVNAMNDELNGFTTLDEYSTLYGKALERYEDLLKKKITDPQLKKSFISLFNKIKEKRLNLDSTIGYQPPEVERAKVELNMLISEIKQDVLTIEHDSNNLGNLAGTEVRLNKNIETAMARVEAACNERLLTDDDREYYMNRLKGYQMAIQSEAKIGFGIR